MILVQSLALQTKEFYKTALCSLWKNNGMK